MLDFYGLNLRKLLSIHQYGMFLVNCGIYTLKKLNITSLKDVIYELFVSECEKLLLKSKDINR